MFHIFTDQLVGVEENFCGCFKVNSVLLKIDSIFTQTSQLENGNEP